MDLDTPSELLLTPSVSFSTSVSSSTSDVFSLLLTQLHQCHTQRITELEQKVNHLSKKCQKLIQLSRERGELALRYRQTCQDLKKENHALKKALKEGNRKHHKSDYPDISGELQLPKEDQKKNGSKSPPKCSDTQDFIEPDKLSSSKIPSGSSKLSRLKKKNRKVRYKEVSISPKDDVRSASKLSSKGEEEEKEPLFVPETIDPDLDVIDDDDNENISSSHSLAERYSKIRTEKEQLSLEKKEGDSYEQNSRIRDGADDDDDGAKEQETVASQRDLEETHLPSSGSRRRQQNLQEAEASEYGHRRTDVKPKDASTPVDNVRKILSLPGSPPISMDGMTMSPVILDEISLDEDIDKSQKAELENGKLVDNSNTQMSPTFVGGYGLASHSPSLVKSYGLPSVPQDRTPKDNSVSRAFDGTGESEASFLLLQQNVSPSPKVVSSSVTKTSPSKSNILSRTLKRKISPDKRLSKVRKVSIGKISYQKKPGIIRQFTSHPDLKSLEELKRLKQSTLSQHMKKKSKTKQKTTSSTEFRENRFRIPNVPGKGKIWRYASHLIRDREYVETNVGISLNGSIDPIIDLDKYDGDIEPLEYNPSPIAKESASYAEDPEFVSEDKKKRTKEHDTIKRHSLVADKSDLMFDDSFIQEDDDGKDISFSVPEDDLNERQILALKYDRVPKKEERPQYKYKEVVRKHNEREQLKGFDCKQCAEFYEGMGLTDSQKEDRMKVCSRHRGRYTPPSTPEHYWSIGFPDTPTCLKRGYIQEDGNSKVDAEAMPRRRNKLKQLFPKKEINNG